MRVLLYNQNCDKDYSFFIDSEEFELLNQKKTLEGYIYEPNPLFEKTDKKVFLAYKDHCNGYNDYDKNILFYDKETVERLKIKHYDGECGYIEKRYDMSGNKVYIINIDKIKRDFKLTIMELYRDIAKYTTDDYLLNR